MLFRTTERLLVFAVMFVFVAFANESVPVDTSLFTCATVYTSSADTMSLVRPEDTAVYLHTEVLQAFEGYSDTFYVPSSFSGPTIGYGLDIGAMDDRAALQALLTGVVSERTVHEICSASGLRGSAAKRWVRRHHHMQLTESQINIISNRMYTLYLNRLLIQYPHIKTTNACVRTAVLSYFMHHGNVRAFDSYLRKQDYRGLATALDHHSKSSSSFHDRRHAEAQLIRLGLSGQTPEVSVD